MNEKCSSNCFFCWKNIRGLCKQVINLCCPQIVFLNLQRIQSCSRFVELQKTFFVSATIFVFSWRFKFQFIISSESKKEEDVIYRDVDFQRCSWKFKSKQMTSSYILLNVLDKNIKELFSACWICSRINKSLKRQHVFNDRNFIFKSFKLC